MKKDNYKMKFANFITSRIIIPMFIFLDIIFCIIFYFEDKTSFFENSLIATITIAIMSLLTYFALIIVGNILSKNQNFRQDDLYFYQDNRKILKTDLLRIDIYWNESLNYLSIIPKKDLFKAKELLYYFSNYEDVLNFLIKNDLIGYLNGRDLNFISSNNNLNERMIEGYKEITRFPCPCCGNLTYFTKPGGTFFICPVCFWEDDESSIEDENTVYDINKVSLLQARFNYIQFKACKEDMIEYVREPEVYEYPKMKVNDEK